MDQDNQHKATRDFREPDESSQPVTKDFDDNALTGTPKSIGRFEVQQVLGEGGFAQVYLAYDPSLDRQVAIKVPHLALRHEFLRREARMAARLKHPAIVQIYEICPHSTSSLETTAPTKDPAVYVVMQYVAGTNLADKIETEKLNFDCVVDLMLDVSDAVGFAHSEGVLHRDLKPQNILLDVNSRPYVADFGLAVSEASMHRHVGEFCGTPAYMSPEQAQGRNVTPASDVWSLGVILYEMLTRERPFGTHPTEVMSRLGKSEPERPGTIDGAIPQELERICLKCLRKDSAERYQSCADLAADLRKWKKYQTDGPSDDDVQKAEQYYKQAFANVDSGDLSTAIDQLQTALRLNPDSASGYYLLGLTYLMSDKPAQLAVEPLTRAIDLNRDNAAANYALANLHYEAEAYQQAASFADQALEGEPSNQAYREFQRLTRKRAPSDTPSDALSSKDVSYDVDAARRRRLSDVAEATFHAEKSRQLTLKHWITDHFPWRLIRRRPLLGSLLIAFISYAAVMVLLLPTGNVPGIARMTVVWIINWTLLYYPFLFARMLQKTYVWLLPIINVPEDAFRRFYTRQAAHVLGGTCGMKESGGRSALRQTWQHNRLHLLVALLAMIPACVLQYLCGFETGLPGWRYWTALSCTGLAETFLMIWVWPFAIFSVLFVPRFYNVPVRYFLGMPVELSFAAIGKFYVHLARMGCFVYCLAIAQHYVFRTYVAVPIASTVYVAVFIATGITMVLVTQYQLYSLLRRLKVRRILEYSYHLESAFERVMKKPTRQSFDDLRAHRAFMKDLGKLSTRGLTRSDLLQLLVIVAIMTGVTCCYWYLVIHNVWFV